MPQTQKESAALSVGAAGLSKNDPECAQKLSKTCQSRALPFVSAFFFVSCRAFKQAWPHQETKMPQTQKESAALSVGAAGLSKNDPECAQ
jgi:hypothetical protein